MDILMLARINVLIFVEMGNGKNPLMGLRILVMMGMMMIMMDVQALVDGNLILNVNIFELFKMIQIQKKSVNVFI